MFVTKRKYEKLLEEYKSLESSRWTEGYNAGVRVAQMDAQQLEELKKLNLLNFSAERAENLGQQLAIAEAKIEAMLKLARALNWRGQDDE